MKKLASKNIFQLRKLFRRQTKKVGSSASRLRRFRAKRGQEQREGITEGVSEETIALLRYILQENIRGVYAIAGEARGRTSKVKREVAPMSKPETMTQEEYEEYLKKHFAENDPNVHRPRTGTAGAPAPHVQGETR